MASLYTPAPQREGLDWLSGMVRSGQNLWQNERQLQQAAQRLALAKKQQDIQTQEFWATQARLKRQEDFQNRKFMYEIGSDQRAEQRQAINDERLWKNTVIDNELEQSKFNATQDPNNRHNKYLDTQIEKNRVGTALDQQEFDANQSPPFSDIGELTPKVDPSRGIDKMFSTDGNGDPAGSGDITGFNLLPELEAGQARRTGDPNNPVMGKDPTGNPYMVSAAGFNKTGKATYYTTKLLEPKAGKDPLDQELNTFQDNLASLRGRLRDYPAYPSGENPNAEAVKAYEERKTEIDADNVAVRQEMVQVSKQLNDAQTKRRLRDTPLVLNNITPEFEKEVSGELMTALKAKNPAALRSVRPKVETLALKGDPSAQQALQFLDTVLGKEAAAKPKKTGYF